MVLQQLMNGLQNGAMYAMLALGFSMVYGVLKLMNFAHGDVFMMGAFIGVWSSRSLLGDLPLPFVPTVIASMLLCAIINVAIERIAYRPLRDAPRLSMLITAMAMSMILEHGMRALIGAQYHPFPDLIPRTIHRIGSVYFTNTVILTVALALGLTAITQLIVKRSRLGKAMRAVSFDLGASILMGINVNTVISFTFAIGGALAGAAAILYGLAYPSVEPYMGLLPGLKGFIACAIGGIGSVPGAVLGGLLLGLIETVAGGFLSSSLKDAISFTLLILFLTFRPSGLLNVPWYTERV